MHARQQLFIGGQWVDGTAQAFDKRDPITGDTLWQARAAGDDQVTSAVAAAREAFPGWARRPLAERQALLERFRDQLEANREALAEAIAHETGKPLWESRTEVGAMIGKIGISITAHSDRTGERSRDVAGGTQAVLRHRPHGVLAVFGPYNFPGHLPNGHIVPPLLPPDNAAPAPAACW